MEMFTISPSELSYLCNHCAYIGKNFNLYPKMISAGVTQTLDSMEKEYFLGDAKKLIKELKMEKQLIHSTSHFSLKF